MQRQKEFELAEFKMLHSEEGGERDQGGDRCVVLLDSGWEMLLGIMLRLQKLSGGGSRGPVSCFRYCLTAAWFRAWEAWVCGRAKEPPG